MRKAQRAPHSFHEADRLGCCGQGVCSRRSKANSSHANASTLRQCGSASADRGAQAAASASRSQNICHKMAAEVAACAPKPRLPPAHYDPLPSCRVAGSGGH